MRIRCPYCGERSNDEFTMLGDADALLARPTDSASQAFHDYAYLRTNPAGQLRELWYHAAGCRRWLVVTRDTRTHEVADVAFASARARDALAKGIAVDLDASAFKIGDAAQTSAAHIGLQIALIDDTPTFEIISARSTAGSFWSWLTASAAEYGIEVV